MDNNVRPAVVSIERVDGVAGQYALDVVTDYAGDVVLTSFVSSVYGAPVVMIWHGDQVPVTDWQRFGDVLDDGWVRRFYGEDVDQVQAVTAGPGTGDVMVTATLVGDHVNVTCRLMPGAGRWTEPRADMVRGLVDKLAARHGMTRTGRREHTGGWSYRYAVTS